MKKKTTKPTKAKSAATRSVNVKTAHRATGASSWSMSIYVYWFIILFFIAATFFILGRSQFTSESRGGLKNGIAEEVLMRANDYYNNGKNEILAGNLDGAIADLTSAITTDGNMVSAYILRGEAYMQAGDYRAALNDFNTAIKMDPQNSVAYYDRSLLNTRLEDFESAMTDINNALATYAANPNEILQMRDLYAKRGQLNLWQKNWEGAIADYTNSLARPEGIVSPSVYAERAEAYTAIGNYADAVNDYTSAIRVISEQIQGATTIEQKEDLSMRAMNYFEKSAALNLSMGNAAAAKSDLESAYQIAASLNDPETVERFQGLLEEME
mgnify:CR=1 FL=1